MLKNTLLLWGSLLLAALHIHAQPTGQVFTFDGNTPGLGSDAQYSFTEEEGILEVNVDKYRPWAGFTINLGEVHDLSANPLINLRMQVARPVVLSAYLRDSSNNTVLHERIFATDAMGDYCFDFTGSTGNVDLGAVDMLIFAVNGAALTLETTVWLDEVRVGDQATRFPNFEPVRDLHLYAGTQGFSTMIRDISGASAIQATTQSDLINNLAVSPISNGVATLSFDLANQAGMAEIELTAVGTGGRQNNTHIVSVYSSTNADPTMDLPTGVSALAGESTTIRLSGISDGDPTGMQALSFEVAGDGINLGNASIDHAGDSPYAYLTFDVATLSSGNMTVTITDDGTPEGEATFTFPVDIYNAVNHPPAMDALGRQVIPGNNGEQTILLTGITDGDDETQMVTVTAASADPAVIPNPITVVPQQNGDVLLRFTPNPDNLGLTTLTVTLSDDGGATGNNGNQTSIIDLEVETVPEALTGLIVPMDDITRAPIVFDPESNSDVVVPTPYTWRWEGEGTTQFPSAVQFQGAPAIKIDAVNKGTWSGCWFYAPDLDLSENPSLSAEIYVEGSGGTIDFHVYFWDDNTTLSANGQRNADGAHAARITATAGQWTDFKVNYNTVTDGLLDNDGNPINTDRIQKLLFNYHPSFGWPFTNASFTIYMRNIRIGDEALVPAVTPDATMNGIANQVHFSTSTEQTRTISLSGISDGVNGLATIEVSSNNTALIDPQVSSVAIDGTAQLTYTTGSATGSAQITVTVSADGSNTTTRNFTVQVVNAATSADATVTVNRENTFQTMHGFGTFQPPSSYLDLYANDLGASAMRMGFIANQLEEPNNDNEDPNVLNRDALNYGVMNWDYLRRLKENGVETFILTSWSPPFWMKENLSNDYAFASAPNYEATDNKLEEHFWEEYAEMFVAAVRLYQEEAGIELAAIGPQNEPAFTEPYGSAVMSPEAFAGLVAVIGARFEEEGINTRIFMPEQVFSQNHYSMAQYIDAVQANPQANQYTDIIATHGYAADGVGQGQPDFSDWSAMWNNAQEGAHPKELWMTETFPSYQNWNTALNYAMWIYGAVHDGNVGLWTSWNIEEQLIIRGQPLPSFFTFKNYSKYVRPGAVRIEATDTDSDLYVTAYEDAEEGTLVTVIINLGNSNSVIELLGDDLPLAFEQFTTQEFRNFEKIGTIADGKFLLPARSVTTLVGDLEATASAPQITSELTASASEGQSFSYQLTASNNPTSYAASGLPNGLAINTATGLITGTPADGTAGTVNVTLTATNSFGSGNATLVLTLSERANVLPVAAYTATTVSGQTPLEVVFDASGSSDLDGSIVSYDWAYDEVVLGAGVNLTVTFTNPGVYEVVLTVTDNAGGTATRTRTITVTEADPYIFTPASARVPGNATMVTFNVAAADQDDSWTATTAADWLTLTTDSGTGDGNVTAEFAPNPSTQDRQTTIDIGPISFALTQEGSPVVAVFTPMNATFTTAGGNGTINVVATPNDGPYAVSTLNFWINLDVTELTGNGTVTYTVEENNNTRARNGAIFIAGEPFVVSQAAYVEPAGNPWEDVPFVEGTPWKETHIGFLWDDLYPFVYHFHHGWLFVMPEHDGTMMAYNWLDTLGWLYLVPDWYPDYLYAFTYESWVAYILDSGTEGNEREFYDYGFGAWDPGFFVPSDRDVE